jgi:insulin-like growth factor 2 mRNA-binding protein 1
LYGGGGSGPYGRDEAIYGLEGLIPHGGGGFGFDEEMWGGEYFPGFGPFSHARPAPGLGYPFPRPLLYPTGHYGRYDNAFLGQQFMGSQLRVEPSMPRRQFGRSCRVAIRALPADVDWKEFESLLGTCGDVVTWDQVGTLENPSAVVVYKYPDQAKECVYRLNGYSYHGNLLKASFQTERAQNSPTSGGSLPPPALLPRPGLPRIVRRSSVGWTEKQSGSAEDFGAVGPNGPDRSSGGLKSAAEKFNSATICDMPLRMAVDARFVGAIIGQGGNNIRQITRECSARCVVDVNRGLRDAAGNVEKVINIYGLPENCSKACLKILEVVNRELAKNRLSNGEKEEEFMELKLRAHNNLMGRLIGRAGGTIKRIMAETETTIFVSNISELNAFNLERSVIIRSESLEHIGSAEEKISAKLRQFWEYDCKHTPASSFGLDYPFLPLIANNPLIDPYTALTTTSPSSAYSGGSTSLDYGLGKPQMPLQPPVEVVTLHVPNMVVGALIGSGGVHIRNVMRMTGAHMRIEGQTRTATMEALQADGGPGQHPANAGALVSQTEANVPPGEQDRLVTITGTEQEQYKAQFCVFQRISEQCCSFFEDVRLNAEVRIPRALVGRVIGRGGQNVRELQRTTGAYINIPDDAEGKKESAVKILGNFNAIQAVQNRFRHLCQQYLQQQHQSQEPYSFTHPGYSTDYPSAGFFKTHPDGAKLS